MRRAAATISSLHVLRQKANRIDRVSQRWAHDKNLQTADFARVFAQNIYGEINFVAFVAFCKVFRCTHSSGKQTKQVLPIHQAQLLSYMKLLDMPIGLIINFHELKVTDRVVRMILPGANQ